MMIILIMIIMNYDNDQHHVIEILGSLWEEMDLPQYVKSPELLSKLWTQNTICFCSLPGMSPVEYIYTIYACIHIYTIYIHHIHHCTATSKLFYFIIQKPLLAKSWPSEFRTVVQGLVQTHGSNAFQQIKHIRMLKSISIITKYFFFKYCICL